jgi:hypothetical protein
MHESGAEVELFYNDKLKVKPCTGCFNCWLKTPGVCSHKDDMAWLLPKMRDADVMVYATPVYSYGMNGEMKNLMDRMIAIAEPFMEVVGGRPRHIPGEGEKTCKIVIVSNCGLWGMDNFDPLVAHVKKLCQYPPDGVRRRAAAPARRGAAGDAGYGRAGRRYIRRRQRMPAGSWS